MMMATEDLKEMTFNAKEIMTIRTEKPANRRKVIFLVKQPEKERFKISKTKIRRQISHKGRVGA